MKKVLVATVLIVAAGALVGVAAVPGARAAKPLLDTGGPDRSALLGDVPDAAVRISPADGATGVRPDTPVDVAVLDGRLVAVRLRPVGAVGAPGAGTGPGTGTADTATGSLSADGTRWTSSAALALGTRYEVTATVRSAHGPTTTRSSFTTLTPTARLGPIVSPGDDAVAGVAQVVVVQFRAPVADRAAVERRLAVTSRPSVEGGWRWVSDHEVRWRPRSFWPAHTAVEVDAALEGVDAGGGVWGERNIHVSFRIGDAQVSYVDVRTHKMVVTRDGAPVKTFDQSAGADRYPTQNGTHMVLEKMQKLVMDSATVGIPRNSPDGYLTTTFWNVRISNSGEFVHGAPWSVDSQGRANVSHGCVNLAPADAQWFFNFSRPGDAVVVTGSTRPPSTTDAGTADWNTSWDQWLAGSALR
ncbi:MAG: L,D-transpeptidase [Acidimicrobiia bacterium]|nr:L,D-transpeptidase family protein [Acidimicrobiia bacterium]MCL4293601.1 L,D-transpeptidase [Acidimicrobiia bacterium]